MRSLRPHNQVARHRRLVSATTAVIESLEGRRLMSASTIQPLPFFLDFGSTRGELVDKDGQGTGFTRVQADKLGTEFQPSLIDLDTTAGVLKITTTGTSTAGSNTNADNTLVNALETQFNATTSGFKLTTRLVGPLSYINTPSEQAGIMFGPDQDNFIKVVAIAQPTGQFIQFTDEQFNGSTFTHSVDLKTSVGSFTGINSLDLQLVGDAAAGTVSAYYSINGAAFVKMSKTITLSGASKSNFFTAAGRAGLIAAHKNDSGPETMIFDSFRIDAGTALNARPSVTATRPTGGDVAVPRDAFVAADVKLPTPGAGIDAATLTSATVKLYRASDKLAVTTVLNTSGAGDAIVATPSGLLDPNTTYTFEVTAGLKDTAGAAFQPYIISFTTGNTGGETDPSLAFEKIALPTAVGHSYTSVVIGPDGKLYAGTDAGLIQRFTINGDGTLGAAQDITSLTSAEGGPRLLTGMAFDPRSTPTNMLLWVAHSDGALDNASDWTGKITRLSGPNFTVVQDAVINLPRSIRDHATNQPVFGPDGMLYFNQGSMSAMGAPDNAWGLRSEHLLNGAILKLDVFSIGSDAIDVKTDSGGTYNPFAPGAPLTLYATGVRNAYDMVWTNDGKLYAPTNGSAAGGNTPSTPSGSYSFGANQRIDFDTNGAYTGPNVPGLGSVAETQNDYLFNIAAGGYYGQPNPLRGEFVLNGGNPSSGIDNNEVVTYPTGTEADRNYRGSSYVFGKNYSPNGIIEYSGSAFGGALNNKLLVVRYSGGDDVVVLTRGAGGNIVADNSGIAGLTNFIDPLDITEDRATGFLYIAEYGGQRITLARPIAPGANLVTDKSKMVFNDTIATSASPGQKITITNTGTSALAFPADAFSLNGVDASRFSITAKPTVPATLAPGASVQVTVTFNANAIGIKTANLQIKSNDPDSPILQIPLRGLGTAGTGGANEPSLQRILDLYQIPLNVGDTNPLDVYLDDPPAAGNDEIIASLLQKAGNGPITIEPLASFGVGNSTVPTTRLGYYVPGNRTDRTELFTITGTTSAQSVNPNLSGTTTFDPGNAAFGIYATWPSMYPSIYNVPGGPEVYSEGRLNQAFDPNSPRKVRFYPLKTADGSVVPNALVMAFEEFNGGYDNQDFVAIIRNVTPVAAGPEIGFENLDNLSFTDRLTFSRVQIQPPDTKTDPLTGEIIQPPNNVVHDVAVLRVRNTGTQSLNISSITISAGWAIDDAPTTPISIPAGGSIDLSVRFTATGASGGKFLNGSLILHSNDADEPMSTIQLSGFWQNKSENPEPTLQQIVNVFGYATTIAKSGQNVNGGGAIARIGDEVLSAYWRKADSTKNVIVRQLAAYHTQGNPAFIRYFTVNATTGAVTQTNLFTHDGTEGQSILPHLNGSLTTPASASFTNNNAFGFRIDSEWSDPTKNTIPPENPADEGHHVRFWVARDRDGKIIPDTYLMAMDYAGINYDYNDNVYLVSNIKPETPPTAPIGLTASSTGAGTQLAWTANTEPNIKGYNVYRSDAEDGTFTKINEVLLTTADFNDVSAPVGVTAYYRITAVDLNGGESGPATINAVRPSDITPPASPDNLVATGSNSGITLDWSNNTDGDLAGYNVYRSDTFGGLYVLLNTSELLNASNYFDSSAPAGVTSYYRVTAVDTSGNESAANIANAQRNTVDVTPPAAPNNLSAVGSLSSIALDWNNNIEIDLAGYNVYRSSSQFGTYTKLNASGLLNSSDYIDTAANAGATTWYRVTAVDATGNESTATTTSGVRTPDTTAPATPTGATASGSVSGIALDWADNTDSDLKGYNIYRSDAVDGVFTKINASPITASELLDTGAPQSVASYYRITAVDTSNNESDYVAASATHPDSIAPAAPTGLNSSATHSGVTLAWSANTEIDFAGYNVYRSAAPDGIFTKLNDALLASLDYVDTSAAAGAASYYRVTAVDAFGNESDAATTSAFRPNLGANGNANDIAYDSAGVLHFAWYDTVEKTVKYATRSAPGTWSAVQTIDTSGDDVGGWLSLAVDFNNRPAIAYFDGSRGDLRYAVLTSGAWDVQTVDFKNSVGLFPSLKFDNANNPVIAYYKKTTGDLRIAAHNGTAWNIAEVATADDLGRSASLAMQPNGLWAIAYENSTLGLLHYSYQTDATNWVHTTVDTSTAGISYISLAFDPSGRPSMSYQETGLGDLKFAVMKSGKWSTGTIMSKGAVGMYSRLVYASSDGMANIFFYSKQLNTLMHTRGYMGNWTTTVLKENGGRFASAVLGTNTKITFAWLDSASQVLTLDEI